MLVPVQEAACACCSLHVQTPQLSASHKLYSQLSSLSATAHIHHAEAISNPWDLKAVAEATLTFHPCSAVTVTSSSGLRC